MEKEILNGPLLVLAASVDPAECRRSCNRSRYNAIVVADTDRCRLLLALQMNYATDRGTNPAPRLPSARSDPSYLLLSLSGTPLSRHGLIDQLHTKKMFDARRGNCFDINRYYCKA